jgi:hypothetical protein
MGVDFEERADYRQLHKYRIARTKQALAASGLDALLLFDVKHSLRDVDENWRVGARQAVPLDAPNPRCGRADLMGFRLRCRSSSSVLPVAEALRICEIKSRQIWDDDWSEDRYHVVTCVRTDRISRPLLRAGSNKIANHPTFLERFKSWSIDNTKHVLLLEPQ